MSDEIPEKDGLFIRRLIIIIFIVFTVAAAVMTLMYGAPWAKK